MDGQRFSIGDAREPFSIQAIRYFFYKKWEFMSDAILLFSKPITYAVTLSELGEEVVHKYQVLRIPK